MNKLNWQAIDIRIIAVIASLLLSCFTFAFPEPLNDDAFLYLRTAEIFVDSGLSAAYEHYSWATYSVLIGLLSLTGLTILQAAFLINSLFFALLTYAFISVVKTIDNSTSTMLAAAILVLVFPELNEYRHFLIRDIGFWALVFLAIWQLSLFTQSQKIGYGATFCISLLLAASLRIEAIVYLLLVPFTLLFFIKEKAQFRLVVFLNLGSVLVLMIIAALLFLGGTNVVAMASEFLSRYLPFLQNALFVDSDQSFELATAIFGSYGEVYSGYYLALFMAAGFFALLLVSIANALGLPLLAVLVVGLSKQLKVLREKKVDVLLAFIAVNFLIVFGFIYITRFLPSRYSMVLAISIVALIPILANQWFEEMHARLKGWQKFIPLLVVIYLFVDSYISFGRSKDYIDNAIIWLEAEGVQPGQLITNESAIAYFSQSVEDYDRVSNDVFIGKVMNAEPEDLIALEPRASLRALVEGELDTDKFELLVSFPESSAPKILIYRRTQ